MSSLVAFEFEGSKVRTIKDDKGNAWFVAKDVALTLGYKNTVSAVSRHCKDAKSLKDIGERESHSPKQQQNQELINLDPQTKLIRTPDVFALVFGSDLPSAQDFKWWVYEEVSPSIRKTGSYSLDNNQAGLPKLVNELKEEINLLKEEVNNINELKEGIDLLNEEVNNINKYNAPNASFTLTEIVYYINENYGTEAKILDNETMWNYLKKEIKMIKPNNKPHTNEINNKFIIRSKNNPFLEENDYGILFTRLGVIKILEDIKNKGHID